jgi:PAS domain-containing protein
VADCGEYQVEYRVRDAANDLSWVLARGHVECDESGDPVRFSGVLVDITERKRIEREFER